MMKHYKHYFSKIPIFLLIFFTFNANALSLTDLSTTIGAAFEDFYSDNEGTTSFRSLMIPIGGRAESLGSSFTGLADDVSYLFYNPAAACVLKESQMAVFHNTWIADSQMDSIAFTNRENNFGFGTMLSCFYIPFTEYNLLGERAAGGYYSETTLSLNAAYNFIAGYDFKGLAVGMSLKGAWRSMPDYTDNDTNAILTGSGLSQSSLGLMMDFGLLMQFNLWKFFESRDPNVKLGFAIENAGFALTGFGNEISFDDPLPTFISAGMSVKFLPIITATVDIKQPINLYNITKSGLFSFGTGADIQFTEDFSLLAGFELKGGNPKISAGAEFELNNTRLNFNYTLDLTTSINPINRISVEARIMLGDRGRKDVRDRIDTIYKNGLKAYYEGRWQDAINFWNIILTEYNKRYDPAIAGIQSAQAQLDMLKKARESMYFNE